jgi:hypothetical protein
MANVYIEAHPKDGGSVKYYVVEDHANHILATAANQAEAVAWAKSQLDLSPLAAPPFFQTMVSGTNGDSREFMWSMPSRGRRGLASFISMPDTSVENTA